MAYEIFKKIKTKEDYLKDWDSVNRKNSGKQDKEDSYHKYVGKCESMQRDNFTCQNRSVDKDDKMIPCIHCNNVPEVYDLTSHHIKFQKNFKDDRMRLAHRARNRATICDRSHKDYNDGKRPLIFSDNPELPPRIRGQVFIFQKPININWKKVKAELKLLRKDLKNRNLIIRFEDLNWEMVAMLLRFMQIPYTELYDD